MKAVTASEKKSICSNVLKVVQKFMKDLGRWQRKQNDSKLRDVFLLVGLEARNDVSKGTYVAKL